LENNLMPTLQGWW